MMLVEFPEDVNSYTFREGNETNPTPAPVPLVRPNPIVRSVSTRQVPVPLASVGKLLLTHHHIDHMGGAAYLRETTKAPISCHRKDVPFCRRPNETADAAPDAHSFCGIHPAPVAVVLNDGDRIGPLPFSMPLVIRPGRWSSITRVGRSFFRVMPWSNGRVSLPFPPRDLPPVWTKPCSRFPGSGPGCGDLAPGSWGSRYEGGKFSPR